MPNDWQGFRRISVRFIQSRYFLTALLLLFLTVVGVVVAAWQWDWLQTGGDSGESNGATLRNAALVFAAVLALGWRAKVADNQSKTAQRGLQNERYQRGAEMLGHSVLATRIGGIYLLRRLAEEYPDEYHVQVMGLLCAFARRPTKDDGEPSGQVREDVQSAIYAINACRQTNLALELECADSYRISLASANFECMDLSNTNLANADLRLANLSSASFSQADLSGTIWTYADIHGANLSGAKMTSCGLPDGSVQTIKGLTQKQLNSAYSHSGCPPIVEAYDAETSERLTWIDRKRPQGEQV